MNPNNNQPIQSSRYMEATPNTQASTNKLNEMLSYRAPHVPMPYNNSSLTGQLQSAADKPSNNKRKSLSSI